jgi:PST family polysaccharide transporter
VSLARKAVRGAVWTILSSVGARLVGVVGTLVLTHLIAPDVVGEVSVATVLVMSANQFSSFGFGQFVVANPKLPATGVFQVAMMHLAFGLIGVVAVVVLAAPLSDWFDAPAAAAFVPGLAMAILLQRVSVIPERVLIRDMRFAAASLARTLGELTYVATAVGLAWRGWGGEAIVMANVTRALVRTALLVAVSDRRKWLVRARLEGALMRDVFHFGTPLWIGASASFASGKWDNLLFAGLFGPHQLGLYTLGYNLADIPTSHVGEHIGDVLLPSFTRMDEAQRRRALVRSIGLLALIVFPLAIGLGAVADTLVAALFNDAWQGVAAYLAILSALSVARPVGWIIFSYLQSQHRTRACMVLEVGKLAAILGGIAALSVMGPYWAAGGVGVGFALHALASMWLLHRTDRVSMRAMLRVMTGPLVACVPMVGAVLAVRHGLCLSECHPAIGIAVEVTAGAAAYVVSCFVAAREVTGDFLGLLRRSFRGGVAGAGTVEG